MMGICYWCFPTFIADFLLKEGRHCFHFPNQLKNLEIQTNLKSKSNREFACSSESKYGKVPPNTELNKQNEFLT
jgi:hypothetical protein